MEVFLPMTEFAKQRAQQQAARWLISQHQASIPPAEQDAFEQWLAQGVLQQEAYQHAVSVWQQAGLLLISAKQKTITKKTSHPLVRFAVAACLVLAVGVVWQVDVVTMIQADVFTGQHGQRFDLADGSHVLLDAHSAIAFDYSKQERRVNLIKGAATFYVEGAAEPFNVYTSNTQVQALGTIFMVSTSTAQTEIAVLEHAVQVDLLRAGQSVQLNEGQSVSILPDAQRLSTIGSIAHHQQDWQQGYLVFDQQPLSEVVARIERYCPYKVLLFNAELAQQKVSAVLHLDRLDEELSALADTFALKQYQAPGIMLLL